MMASGAFMPPTENSDEEPPVVSHEESRQSKKGKPQIASQQ